MYNAWISTSRRLKKGKSFNEGATAGMPKSPSRGGKSREELQALGERMGFADRELTAQDVAALSADEYLWFEKFFPVRLEHAATLAENQRLNRERMPTWNVRRMWSGGATAEEDSAARIAGNQFALRCPQFQRSVENAQAIVEWMQAHDLDATQVESYLSAFRGLVEEGKLTPAPVQSADDFLAQHPELRDTRTPPLTQARNAKAEQTRKHFEAAANATAKGTITSLTDYPNEQRTPPEPEKYSFKQKIRSMSASEIAARCQDDPAFRKALDELK